MLWVRDALRDIPEEVVKNCWRKAGILPFEVNQRYIPEKVVKNCWRKAGILPFKVNQWYIEDKEVMKGDVHLHKAADHLADLFGKLSLLSV